MSSADWRTRVRTLPGEPAGRATIGPTGPAVADVLRRLAAGDPTLDPADVRACLTYAADVLATVAPPLEAAATLPPIDPNATLPPTGATATADRHAVPGYEIVDELGRGGMGVVYRARQVSLNRTVALKMILAGGHAGVKERTRFRAEAEAVARLQHPNIVQIYEVGEHAGLPYFSLEHVPGGTLAARLDGTPWPADRATTLVETLARTVHAAHAAGIVHRDLKPANVLLAADDVPKITDFGLAKRLESDGPTRTGEVMGTPEYMAPEQAAGRKDVGPAADVWALGAILYELLTGRPPFRGPTSLDTILQVMEQELVPVRRLNRAAGRDLEAVCWKCLHKDATKRYASAADLADDLGRALDHAPVRAKPPGVLRRLNDRTKRVPETASLGLVIVFLMLAASMVASGGSRVFMCTAILALAATARVSIRPVLVGAAVGLVPACALAFGPSLIQVPEAYAGIPEWVPWLLVPAGALSAGIWRRETWFSLAAYLIPVAVLVYTVVATAQVHADVSNLSMLAVSGLVAGTYFAAVGRFMAWWVGGSLTSAILGAFGGMVLSGIMFGILLTTLSSGGGPAFEYLFGIGYFGCIVAGTVTGAFLGARRKRRRAA